jgi:triphosphatase
MSLERSDESLLRPDTPAGEAARSMVQQACTLIEHGWQLTLADNGTEGPHTLRIGLRQLRVVLRIFRNAENEAANKALSASLIATGQHVGRLRDLDVLIGDLVAPLLSTGMPDGGGALATLLEKDRAKVRAAVRKRLLGKPAQALRVTLATLPPVIADRVTAAEGKTKIGKLGRRDLRRRWRKIAADAAHLESATIEELHVLRKSLKNVRYAFAHFAPFWESKPAQTFDAHLRRIQTSFGYLNDIENARSLMTRTGRAWDTPKVSCAIGFVLGWHSERSHTLRTEIDALWQDLAATKIAQDLAQ